MTNLVTTAALLMSLTAATLRIVTCHRLPSRATTRELVVRPEGGGAALRAVATDRELSLELTDRVGRTRIGFAYQRPTTPRSRPEKPGQMMIEATGTAGWRVQAGSQSSGVTTTSFGTRASLADKEGDVSLREDGLGAHSGAWGGDVHLSEHGLHLGSLLGTSLLLRAIAEQRASLDADLGYRRRGRALLVSGHGQSTLEISPPDSRESIRLQSGPRAGIKRSLRPAAVVLDGALDRPGGSR